MLKSKLSSCKRRSTIPWPTLAISCSNVFIYSSSIMNCVLVGKNEMTWKTMRGMGTWSSHLLFSLGVLFHSVRNGAPLTFSSTCCWAQWKLFACACTAFTQNSRDLGVLKLVSNLYGPLLGWHWNIHPEEETENDLSQIWPQEEEVASIWKKSRRPYYSDASLGRKKRRECHRHNRASKSFRFARGSN